jgi:hypothetical protein
MLSFVPDSLLEMVVNMLLLVGAVSTFLTLFVINRILRWVPSLAPFYPFLQALSVLILAAGIFFKGSYATEAAWRAKVAEAEAKVAVAEQQAKEANIELEKKGGEKIKYIRGRTEYITEYVDREVVKYDVKFAPGGECELPKEFIKSLNMAAERPAK